MNSTIVAVFDEYGQAQSAMQALFSAGFSHSDIKLSPAENTAEARQSALRGTEHTEAEPSSRWHIGNIFRSMLGTDQHSDDAGIYAEAIYSALMPALAKKKKMLQTSSTVFIRLI